MVVPVMPMFNDYATDLQTKLHLQGIVIDTDLDDGWANSASSCDTPLQMN
jgi:hypothetical protein